MSKVKFALEEEEEDCSLQMFSEEEEEEEEMDSETRDNMTLSQIFKAKGTEEEDTAKQSQVKKRRRASLTTQKNKQVMSYDPGNSKSSKFKRCKVSDFCDPGEEKTPAMETAERIQANLDPQFPSFVKLMLPSQVSGGFWLGLAKQFCKMHMPKMDTFMVLEDDSGEEYRSKYLAEKCGLSGGWKGFAIAHNLLNGDVLVFQLVQPSKFKVFIVRSNCVDDIDGALDLLDLETGSKFDVPENGNFDMDTDVSTSDEDELTSDKDEHLVSHPSNVPVNNNNEYLENDSDGDKSSSKHLEDKSTGNNAGSEHRQTESDADDNAGSEMSYDDIQFAHSSVEFKDIKSIDDFTIRVNGLVRDFMFTRHVRCKYYELCRSQGSFLHENLLPGINCKLAEGMILEVINIADALRTCGRDTSYQELEIWKKTLKGCENLGMNVGFLRERLKRLTELSYESRMLHKASQEKIAYADDLMKSLQAKLSEIREAAHNIDSEVKALKADCEQNKIEFLVEAGAPW